MARSERVVIRPIKKSDIGYVLKIENDVFPVPFTRDMLEEIIEEKHYKGDVAEVGGAIVGYSVYSHIIDEMQILTIAVAKPHRRRKIANMLMKTMFDIAAKTGTKKIFLEVRESNLPAQMLYKSCGFEEIGRRKGYYNDGGEDAIVMAYVFE